eukprot:11986955-Karenia_brevis.AAC.1
MHTKAQDTHTPKKAAHPVSPSALPEPSNHDPRIVKPSTSGTRLPLTDKWDGTIVSGSMAMN